MKKFFACAAVLLTVCLACWAQVTSSLIGQLSLVGGWDWKRFDLATFNDFWSCQSLPLGGYSETRAYFKVNRRLEAGTIITLSFDSYNPLSAALFLGIKVVL